MKRILFGIERCHIRWTDYPESWTTARRLDQRGESSLSAFDVSSYRTLAGPVDSRITIETGRTTLS